ncbi:hypothetical protein SeMB42_g07798 [Synchytrium endobioticum]|nr:hypothetical protein SeMB42_g07798 [Synchytrium endobioticum]
MRWLQISRSHLSTYTNFGLYTKVAKDADSFHPHGMRMEVFAACNKAALALGVSVLPDLATASKNMLICEGPGNFCQKGVGIIGPSPHNPSRISSDISSGMSLNVRPNCIVSIGNSVDGRLT